MGSNQLAFPKYRNNQETSQRHLKNDILFQPLRILYNLLCKVNNHLPNIPHLHSFLYLFRGSHCWLLCH